MFYWIENLWSRYPNWMRWPALVFAFFLANAVFASIGRPDFFSSVGVVLAATTLRYGCIAIGILLGFLVGREIFRRTANGLIASIVGISLGLAIVVFGMGSVRSIPGVGAYIQAMDDDSCYTDWDGRSNPTVC